MLAAPTIPADFAGRTTECTLLRNDAIEDRWQQHQIDESGIELSSPAGRDHVGGRPGTTAAAIAPAVRHRVEGIREHNDASRQRYRVAAEAIGISASIPAFVVTQHPFRQIGIEGSQWSENRSAAIGVGRDGASLGGREVRVLVNDVEQRFMGLADVVKERDAFDDSSLVIVELRRVREHESIRGDTPNVSAGLCIVGVDGVEECLEARGGKALSGFAASPFANEEDTGEDAGEDAGSSGKSRSHGATQGKIHTFSTRRAGERGQRTTNARAG